jgi:hypothetical protein
MDKHIYIVSRIEMVRVLLQILKQNYLQINVTIYN